MKNKKVIQVYDILQKELVDAITVEEYLGGEETIKIEKETVEFSKSWWQETYNASEMNYCTLLQIKVYYLVLRIIKYEKLIYDFLNDKKNYNLKICIRDFEEWDILKYILKKYNDEIRIDKSFEKIKLYSIKSIIKTKGFEYISKYFSDIFVNVKVDDISENLIVQEVNNNSMISQMKKLEEIYNKQSRFNTIVFGKSLNKKVNNINTISTAKISYLLELPKINKTMKFIVKKSNFYMKVNQYVCKMCNVKIDGKQYEKYINSYLKRELVGLGLYEKAINKILMKKQIKRIFLASDSHAISRLICILAKKYDVQTYVMQHGSIGKLAFTPIYADYFLAWGQQSMDFLINNNEDLECIKIVGNIKYSSGDFRRSVDENTSIKEILWAVNPIGDDINISLFNVLNELMDNNNILSLTIKLHPGDSNSALFKQLISKSSNAERIQLKDRDTDIKKMIEMSDLVVITQSTTGLEAMMMKKIVALYINKAIPNIIEYNKFNSVVEFSNSYELKHKLSLLDEKKVLEMNNNSEKLVKYYMEPFNKIKFEDITNIN